MVRNFGGQPSFSRIFPKSLPAHSIECFCQIHEGDVEHFVLFPALLLNLPQDKHHVCGYPVGSEASLHTVYLWWGEKVFFVLFFLCIFVTLD